MMMATAATFHSAAVLPTPSRSSATPSAFCAASCTFSCCFSSVYSSSHRQQLPIVSCSANCAQTHFRRSLKPKDMLIRCSAGDPLKVMICGAPASGKGTQCELIVNKYGLIHVSTGDLLRAEVSAGTEIGMKAKDYMNSGRLVPDEIVTAMVINRLSREDAVKKGWLLDGYPRTASQAESLEQLNCRPNAYVVLDVLDEVLVGRCVGRRLDPVTGRIYHIENFPPETEEIRARLITRGDDTEEKVKSRLEIYKKNVESTTSFYSNIMIRVDGNRSKSEIFDNIDSFLSQAQELSISRTSKISTSKPSTKDKWRGVPTRLNNIPHSREIRNYFYDDVLRATERAVSEGRTRLKIEINIPELNPEMDVYRIGTLMELVRVLALAYADDGKRVKVCVQGSMGEGALAGMPLQLAGTRKILEFMDWGDYGAKGDFIKLASIGAREVDEEDDIFFLIAPQNAVGNCIIDDLKAMTDAAGGRPVILINPRLKDLPGSSGIMQTMGREKRLEYAASFETCYVFRLLYYAGTQYPIMGALRMSFPYDYVLYKRVDRRPGEEEYVKLCSFSGNPTTDDINNAFLGRSKEDAKKMSSFWGILNSLFN